MSKIVLMFRRMFCKHEFEIEEMRIKNMYMSIELGEDIFVYMRCKKCGYHEKHKKF